MKKIILFSILLCLFVPICFSQKRQTPINTVKPQPIQKPIITEVSDSEWKILTAALQSENWEKSAILASQYLQKIKIDNEKKQLAQLRYFYLYALAGKILTFSSAKKIIEENAAWEELDKAVGSFIGKEFVLPPRRLLNDCKEVVNYICAVTGNDRALRVTATNKTGTAIHSFDYVGFDEKILSGEFAERETFLGGKLKTVEFNQDMSKPWVMRLIFEKGFVSLVVKNDK
ncbi:MAG: hypothetical protein M3R14_12760 [Acidobacteriota bacterium]|nr:hypothetical protein [Acidobacteriota bacterium]